MADGFAEPMVRYTGNVSSPARHHSRAALRERFNGSTIDRPDSDRRIETADVPLGQLLQVWRTRALLTQEELAERTGLSVRTIRRHERTTCTTRPRFASIRLLAQALDLNDEERAMLAALSHGSTAGPDGRSPTSSSSCR